MTNIYTKSVLLEAWNSSNKPVGKYLILEDFDPNATSTKLSLSKDPKTGKPVGKAIFQSGGVRNRNGRIYMSEDLDREIHCARTLELLRTKNLFCEAGHPIDTSLQRQSTIDWTKSNCKILTLEMNSNNVEGLFTPSNTPYGKAFAEDLLEGMIPAFSLRALGSIRQTRLGAQVTDLRMITYDQVIYPSHSNAYMTELLGESNTVDNVLTESTIALNEANNGNKMIPITFINNEAKVAITKDSDSIKSFIEANSNNIKYINDYFGTTFESVTIEPSGTKVVLKENNSNNKIFVDVESYIHCELMNYANNL